jgi:hypothetical protein
MRKSMKIAAGGMRLILATALLAWPALAPAGDDSRPNVAVAETPPPERSRGANFLGQAASNDARRVANWVVASGDNAGLPFIIVDKIRARVFVFDRAGLLRGATLALLGRARGDDTVPGIGSRKLSTIRPEERTTPAGRFVAGLGHDFEQDVLWIDYDASISLHRVITGDPGDHRRARLATTSTLDKRISYGCINVPIRFYEDVVLNAFTGTRGVVYILPEIKPLREVFTMSNVEVSTSENAIRVESSGRR